MSRAKPAKQKIGICTYCGLQRPLTRDHIPPKLFLAKPYPTLLTVPSCIECNQSFQADDEYTRIMAVTDLRNWNFEAQSKLPAILRSLQRPNAAGFGRYLRNQSTWIRLFDPRGNPITRMELDKARVNTAAARLLKGLHFVETGRRLLPTDRVPR